MRTILLLNNLKRTLPFLSVLYLLTATPGASANISAARVDGSSTGHEQSTVTDQPPAGLTGAEWAEIKAQIADSVSRISADNDPQAVNSSISYESYLKAHNTGPQNGFGWAVATSGDTLVIGAPQLAVIGGHSNSVFVFVRDGGAWVQQANLKPANDVPSENYRFGRAVAISGDTIIVGAMFEDGGSTGVNGDDTDTTANAAGAAYVFVRNGGIWTQQAYLKASNTQSNDQFGVSVGISGDTAVVGAWFEDSNAVGVGGNDADNSLAQSGAAYVFYRNADTWIQQAYLKASNTGAGDYFGESVAISDDTIVIGAYGEDSGALGVDGNQADNSVYTSGAAYLFVRTGNTWTQDAYVKATNSGDDDYFGDAVAVSGNTVAIGAQREASRATGINGDQADNSLFGAGAVYVYVHDGFSWGFQAYVKASNTGVDNFGYALSISGDYMVIGAVGESSSAFGVDGDQSDNSAAAAGAAYVFSRSASQWSQQAYLKASNTGASDAFGNGVAIFGNTVLVGAFGEDSSATGADGDGSNNSATNAGAAYTFRLADVDAPHVSAPPDIVDFEATAALTPVDLGTATVTDNSGESLLASVDNSGPFALGDTLVTWSATDSSGNTGSDDQLVNVVDTTPPSITAPADVTVEATGETTPVSLGTPTVDDNAGTPVQAVYSDAPAGGFPVGETTVTWTATDASSNSATDTQRVTVTATVQALDLDISTLRATGRAKISRNQSVSFVFKIKNTSDNDTDTGSATLVGVLNATEVYRHTLTGITDPAGGGSTGFEFPAFTPGVATGTGTVTWTVSLDDDDPDTDQETATSKILP